MAFLAAAVLIGRHVRVGQGLGGALAVAAFGYGDLIRGSGGSLTEPGKPAQRAVDSRGSAVAPPVRLDLSRLLSPWPADGTGG